MSFANNNYYYIVNVMVIGVEVLAQHKAIIYWSYKVNGFSITPPLSVLEDLNNIEPRSCLCKNTKLIVILTSYHIRLCFSPEGPFSH